MTTRASASNASSGKERVVREVTIQYNLCNEPWVKYSFSFVAGKGIEKKPYTSARLKKGEVLYLETDSCRYELCYTGELLVPTQHKDKDKPPNGDDSENNVLIDAFRWSRCKRPLPHKLMLSAGIPLPPDHVEVVAENLEWEDVKWSHTGVVIVGKEYTLARVHFLSPS